MAPTKSYRERIYEEYRREYRQIWGRGRFYSSESPPPSLRRYERECRAEFSIINRFTSWSAIIREMQQSDIIYIGDFHPLRQCKEVAAKVLSSCRDHQRPGVLLLEEFTRYEQRIIDQYLGQKLSVADMRKKVVRMKLHGNTSWQGILELLDVAAGLGMDVFGIDVDSDSLRRRDLAYGARIRKLWGEYASPQLFVLTGELHLGTWHLPWEARKRLPHLRSVILHQGLEDVFWRLLRGGLVSRTEVVQLSPSTYCLNTVTPLMRALVAINAHEDPSLRLNSEEIVEEYKEHLHAVIRRALRLPEEKIDPQNSNLRSLERLVHADLSPGKARDLYRRMLVQQYPQVARS